MPAHLPRRLARLSPPALALLATTWILGCPDRGRNEAMLFLARYDALDLDAPVAARRAAIDALRGLALSDEDVIAARDACVAAYETELHAEEQHASAMAVLLEASRGGAETVSTEAGARIEASIQESQEAIEATRELFPRCDRQARTLRLRYATQRGASAGGGG